MAPAVLEDVLACLHYAAGEEVGIELGGGSGLLQRQDPFVDCAGSVLQAGEDVLEDEMGWSVGRHVRGCESFTE